MKISMKALAVAACLAITGCSEIDGVYAPGCIALEGDRIELEDGRFVWSRFTDQIRLGPDGEPVAPFPDFPRRGTFRIDGERLVLTGDDGRRYDDWFIVSSAGRPMLLTVAEKAAVDAGREPPACALVATNFRN